MFPEVDHRFGTHGKAHTHTKLQNHSYQQVDVLWDEVVLERKKKHIPHLFFHESRFYVLLLFALVTGMHCYIIRNENSLVRIDAIRSALDAD